MAWKDNADDLTRGTDIVATLGRTAGCRMYEVTVSVWFW